MLAFLIIFILSTTLTIVVLKYKRKATKGMVGDAQNDNWDSMYYMASIKKRVKLFETPSYDGGRVYLWKIFCGGAIIRGKYVITAAHCFDEDDVYTSDISAVRLVAGRSQTRIEIHTGQTETTLTVQWRSIDRLRVHEKYLYPIYDIAIVTVDVAFLFNFDVRPIDYPLEPDDYEWVCKTFQMALYKTTNKEGESAEELLFNFQTTKEIKYFLCPADWYRNMCVEFYEAEANADRVLIGTRERVSAGALVCPIKQVYKNGHPYLMGVGNSRNNTSRTNVFTRLFGFAEWIENDNGSKLANDYVSIVIVHLIVNLYFG